MEHPSSSYLDTADPRLSRRLTAFSRWAAAGVMLAGGLMLTAWLLDATWLRHPDRAWFTMRADAAAFFVLSGVSLLLLHARKPATRFYHAAPVCAAASVLIALLMAGSKLCDRRALVEWLLQSGLGVTAAPEGLPGVGVTALVLLAAGLSLLLLCDETLRGLRAARWLAAFAGLASIIGLVIHPFSSVTSFEAELSRGFMFLPGCITIGVFSAALLCATPHQGLVGMSISRELDGVLVRRVSPLILIPLLVGWLTEAGDATGLFGPVDTLAINGTLNVFALALGVYFLSKWFGRSDAERRWAGERLKAAELRYRTLFEQSPCGVVLVDPATGRFVEFNGQAHQQLGYSREEFAPLRVFDIEAAFTPEEVRAHFQRMPERFPTRHRTKQGEIREIEVLARSVELGGHAYLQAAVLDVTQTQREHARVQLLAQAIESLSEIVIVTDLRDRIVFVNQAFADNYGHSREEAAGHGWELIWSPNNPPGLLDEIRNATRESGWKGEVKLRAKGGREFTAVLSTSRILDDAGRVTGHALVAEDISPRLEAETQLKLTRQRLQHLLSTTPTIIYSFNLVEDPSTTTFVSDSVSARLGYEPREFLAGTSFWRDLVHPDDAPNVSLPPLSEWVDDAHVREYRMRHRDGRYRWLHDELRLLRNREGQPEEVVGAAMDITELKQAQARLRASEEHYRRLAETSPDGILLTDVAGRVTYVSQRMFELFSAPPETPVLGHSVLDWIGPQSREEARARLHQVLTGDSPLPAVQYQMLKVDGRPFWGEIISTALRDERGQSTGMLSVLRDVTRRKLAEDAVREAHDFNELLLRTIPFGVSLVNREGRILFVNPALEALAGKDAIDHRCWQRYKDDQQQCVECPLKQPVEPGVTRSLEVDGVLGGRVFQISHTGMRYQDQEAVLEVFQDITERRQTEDKVREQARLLDLARDAILVRDLEGRIRYWNHGAELLYGWKAEEVVGRPVAQVLHEDVSKFTRFEALCREKGDWEGDFCHQTRQGRKLTVRSRWTLVRDKSGVPSSVLSINSDITRQRQLEAERLRNQRLETLGEITGGMAHDLNNLVAPLAWLVPTLRQDLPPNEFAQTKSVIETVTQQTVELLKQMLFSGRTVQGQRIAFDPRQVCEELVKLAQTAFPRNLAIEFEAAANLWPLVGDPAHVHQVLLNLFGNARDAMPEGGVLRLTAANLRLEASSLPGKAPAETGPYVRLQVVDTGHGISPENLDRIYEPFFTTKPPAQGIGLGLPAARGIVGSYGGFMEITSQVGRGTTVDVYLPASPESEVSAAPVVGRAPPRAARESVLVVDDEASVRHALRVTLKGHGYRVLTAADGTAALRMYDRHKAKITAVVTDLIMPGLDGLSVVRALKERDPSLPIIASTGVSDKLQLDLKARLEELGVTTCLIKPYATEQLLQALHALRHPGKATDSNDAPQVDEPA